ncbi:MULTISPECIES: hypothetical protein [Pseudoalteromonas]|uniref:hypothetical protein n=1 Tax=Pseudoalteromonas TaxID=53246 RepID=UPI000781242D|nr:MULTISPECIES: hypothetical protein [Pseudoalteromonas]KZY45470.1 hypothetical protein A3733_13560 [Pseudoalteromonas shioyasakiensis]MCO7205798.1 hypothetical protein [Pseudoalteromonas sp. CnMc7-37]RZF81969.1 hypothetical protein EXT43_10065 [Pseudoalteromonas sp. CO109Y]TMO32257.1 hypothetical protein CWC27_19395 [Pseudoalteromonas sp. S4491]TMO40120.1 hypothetical protein CWC26_06320 [Pseudoalteromonas sp. S4488]
MPFIDPADYFLDQKTTAEGTFMPPINSIDLLPEVYREFQCRFGELSINPAEFFHENSKVSRHTTRRIAENQESIDQIIQHYMDTPYNYSPDTVSDMNVSPILPAFEWHKEVPQCLHSLGQFAPRRFYAIDAYVLTGDKLRKILPNKQILVKDRNYDAAKLEKLNQSFYGPSAGSVSTQDSLVFLVGCPWRYMMMFGTKGYRKMLLDLGYILGYYEEEMQSGKMTQLDYFYDNEVDRFLDLDGIEQSIQCVLGVTNDKNGANSHE